MGFYGREAASCSSMLIVLKAILMIAYAIIPVIALPSHNACFAFSQASRALLKVSILTAGC